MKVDRIAKMGKEDKFAVFVDDKLALILSGQSLLDSGLGVGDELEVDDLKRLRDKSSTDKLYGRVFKIH